MPPSTAGPVRPQLSSASSMSLNPALGGSPGQPMPRRLRSTAPKPHTAQLPRQCDDLYKTDMALYYLKQSMPNREVPDELIGTNVRIDYASCVTCW